ncbi:unnamed protein product [Boreogadus saida]
MKVLQAPSSELDRGCVNECVRGREGERERGREEEAMVSLCLIRLQSPVWAGVRGARAGWSAKAPSPHTFHTSHRERATQLRQYQSTEWHPPIALVFILLLGLFEKRENKLILHNYLC